MFFCPIYETKDWWHEGLTAGGEAVLNSRRHFGINLPADKPYLFKPFERLGEHLLGAIRHLTVQLIETKCAFVVQLVQHKQRPFVAEFVNHVPNWTVYVLRIHLLIYFSHIHVY